MDANIQALHDVDTVHYGETTRTVGAAKPRHEAAQGPIAVEFGSGWYHDAAIETAKIDACEAHAYPYR